MVVVMAAAAAAAGGDMGKEGTVGMVLPVDTPAAACCCCRCSCSCCCCSCVNCCVITANELEELPPLPLRILLLRILFARTEPLSNPPLSTPAGEPTNPPLVVATTIFTIPPAGPPAPRLGTFSACPLAPNAFGAAGVDSTRTPRARSPMARRPKPTRTPTPSFVPPPAPAPVGARGAADTPGSRVFGPYDIVAKLTEYTLENFDGSDVLIGALQARTPPAL